MNFSNVGPSHRLQFFTNSSRVGPFHRVQSFRNGLLHQGSSVESQVLPEHLLHHGLLSLWVQRSLQEPAPAQAPHGVTALFGHIHLLWHGVLHVLQGTACLTMVLITGCRGMLAPEPGAPPPLPSSLTWVSAELFLPHILSPLFWLLLHSSIYPCLNMLSQRCYHHI